MHDSILQHALVPLAVLLGAAAAPCLAGSLAASSASTSINVSLGSISGSFQKSSDSSSKAKEVADGDYRIIEIASVAERPGMVRMKLQALAAMPDAEDVFFLFLPQAVADAARLATGGVVTARHRPYGFEFAQGEPRQAFFLVLADEWYRDLQTTAVAL